MAQEAQVQGGPAGARDPPAMLAPFVRYLEESGLVELRVERGDGAGEVDWAAVDNGTRLQALVMLADRFGLGSPYGCDRYTFGPASTPLAEDARTLSRNRARLYDGVRAAVPGSFRKGEFEVLVSGKDTAWLMAASKMARLRAYRDTRDDLIDAVSDDDITGRKPTYPREYVSGILGELEAAGLVTPYP